MKYIVNILKSLSQLLNALLGGNPKMTLSARLGASVVKKRLHAIIICRFLSMVFFWEKGDHCIVSFERDKARTRCAHDDESINT
jgi:hypothetical protein